MQVKRQEAWKPIVITIETEEEAESLYAALNKVDDEPVGSVFWSMMTMLDEEFS